MHPARLLTVGSGPRATHIVGEAPQYKNGEGHGRYVEDEIWTPARAGYASANNRRCVVRRRGSDAQPRAANTVRCWPDGSSSGTSQAGSTTLRCPAQAGSVHLFATTWHDRAGGNREEISAAASVIRKFNAWTALVEPLTVFAVACPVPDALGLCPDRGTPTEPAPSWVGRRGPACRMPPNGSEAHLQTCPREG